MCPGDYTFYPLKLVLHLTLTPVGITPLYKNGPISPRPNIPQFYRFNLTSGQVLDIFLHKLSSSDIQGKPIFTWETRAGKQSSVLEEALGGES